MTGLVARFGSEPLDPAVEPLVELRGVTKSYRRGPEEVHALREVHLTIGAGRVVVLFGPSGSGKSTLLNVLYGWERPDAGEIVWTEGGPGPFERPWRDVALLPQSLGLLEELSVRENVELPIRLATRRRPDEEASHRVDGLLSHLGLEALAERLPSEASVGEQQRAALARALVMRPRLLLADEPTGHQDEGWAKVALRMLQMAARSGTTCFVATHNEEAAAYADDVLRIRDGSVDQHLPPVTLGDDRAVWGPSEGEPGLG
jgi:putative ABC transport system ATP-binding protein